MAIRFRRKPPQQEGKPMVFGERTPEQIQASLEKAGVARKEKTALLEQVKSGELTLARLLSEEFADNERVRRLPVRTVLLKLPGVGVKSADDIIARTGIPEGRRVQGLGQHQREQLLEWRAGR